MYLTHQDASRLSIGEIWLKHHGLNIVAHSSTTYVERLAVKMAGVGETAILPDVFYFLADAITGQFQPCQIGATAH